MNQCSVGSDWSVYLIRTRLNALYCGISNNVERRFSQHQLGKGAKALRGKGPLVLEWSYPVGDKSTALKIERHIKSLPKRDKERLIKGDLCLPIDNFPY